MNRSQWAFRLTILVIVALVMGAIWLVLRQLGMPVSLAPVALSEWLNDQGMFGPLLLMLLMILAVVVGPIPTLPISAASGLVYGMFAGTAIAVIGALAGSLIAFYLARMLGRDAVQKKLGHNPMFSARGSQPFLFFAVLITRLIPLFSFALVSYAAGVTAIHLWRYALATTLGMLPMTFVFAGLGQSFEFNPVLTVIAAVIVLVFMSTLPIYLGRHPNSRLARWLHLNKVV
ncbi:MULTISPECIES: TVP38/TMEM64 family protein [unclassified Marinobacter]|uniref:TVP38/TMEM64 family protein n=1 Tax=unclassified Marinobacter TaxID=83889 RepID=UPI0026E204A1|nr:MULTISPECIES: TVP38/TMEM64 family protein [unclassified Marinobacter]MDO6441913.1 TVP38/TMEM64 family protein [Marinobacter sp. 2_MG-2023]MDO6824703.1 TVP38/TMEM64 family protein [Marinobacter sp. 1_MG-2023]